jgi:ribonucleoside-diphosphate reductase alpha chain
LLAGASGGIEPFFALAIARYVLDGQQLIEVNPMLRAALAALGADGEAALAATRKQGSVRHLEMLPAELRRRFPVALEIAPEVHVRMQAAFQAHVDAAVSKTVNLAPEAPPTAARQLHLKGVTVYRYGSRPGQTLSLVDERARHDCRECAV